MSTEKNDAYYQELLHRWQQRTCTPTEAIELMDYLRQDVSNRTLLNELQGAFRQVTPNAAPPAADPGDRVRNALLKHIQATPVVPVQRRGKYRMLKLAAAAAILLAIAGPVTYRWWQPHHPAIPVAGKPTPVVAGTVPQKAVLTLANGEKIVLDEKGLQQLAQQNNIRTKDGQLIYEKTTGETATPQYNTLTTTAGETFPLVLADGSKIWLNASSSIRFPATFAGNERNVTLTGEAYFEIAHDAHRPFRVQTKQITVDVLGTHFNINAYADEATVNTTLLEGAVKVNSEKGSLQLAPGEQAQTNSNGSQKRITGINTDEIIAWKDGYFRFESADLTTVLKQFAHWYDLEVVYEGPVKPRKFFGMISRSSPLLNVLKLLDANNVVYSINGKKLIVKGEE
ncbi:MAG: FecR domain-containing protein [Chitinophaga sp.]|uniref:FecR family protein n=1 Tax=Chitinophaga sp. TaxID=1869181 RepID=UPI001B20672D|nr:FecR family protein [Chitinophaga sp.]MBO9732154.1 FecR domain-containing protein [Chitinophaga sp.]